jgi:L-gulonolactone oxidase
MERWTNWAGNQRCAPSRIETPSTEEKLVRIVQEARDADERVKVAGAGHSFTGVALTDGRLLRLDNYGGVRSVDGATGSVTVEAGITVAQLNRELDMLGLAMPNLGDIAYQTIAGAISTGTHGTGARLGGLATQVTAMRVVASDGSVIECSNEQEAEIFEAARVGLGALGIISTVTLQCVPAFNLHAIEQTLPVDIVLEELDELVEGTDHFEFFWFPHTRFALTKRNNKTEEPIAPRSRWQEFRDDVLLSNVAFNLLCKAGRLRPQLIPRLTSAIPSSGRVEYIDKSYRVFASPRHVRFYEMEYAIPRAACREALRRVRELIDRAGLLVSFPVEVRFTAADDIPLSTASGRDTCYIAVHMYLGTPYQQYFDGVELIMNEYEGRPHWGKLHSQTAETLSQRYPQWHRFQAARVRLDPDGVFANAYLDRVLGPAVGSR